MDILGLSHLLLGVYIYGYYIERIICLKTLSQITVKVFLNLELYSNNFLPYIKGDIKY
jgi:hypothetical protein